MIGNQHFDRLVSSAPVHFDSTNVDWAGISALLAERGISPSGVVAVSWCGFGVGDIESLTDQPALAMIHHLGVLSSTGKPVAADNQRTFHDIDFAACRRIADADTSSDHSFGKCCIEFTGAGGVLLGRLQWNWRVRRFRDSRAIIAVVAAERDRIMKVIKALAV